MHFTDNEIEEFEWIARNYTNAMEDLDDTYQTREEAENIIKHEELCDDEAFHKLIAYCNKRIQKMNRFETWLEQNHGISSSPLQSFK